MPLSSLLNYILTNVSAPAITEVFVWGILLFFVFAVFQKDNRALQNNVPGILTSLGILGTFTGVVVGLIHFDHTNPMSSIGGLLGGLKTAFITSLVGVTSSVVFKGIMNSPFFKDDSDIEDEDDLTDDDEEDEEDEEEEGGSPKGSLRRL